MDQHEVNGLLDRNQNQDHAQQCEWDEATKKSNVRKESCSWREDEGGFDKQYYLDLILALVREHEPVTRKDINQLLMPKLPDRMTEQQKLRRVNNLLMELRRTEKIENRGSRGKPAWVLGRLDRSGDQG